jgi:glycosyltransferase XagB
MDNPEPRHAPRPVAGEAGPEAKDLGAQLLLDGLIQPHDMMQAAALLQNKEAGLCDILLAHGMIGAEDLLQAQSRLWSTEVLHPDPSQIDARLVDRLGAARCVTDRLLPYRQFGGATIVVTDRPVQFAHHRDMLTELFGPVLMAIAPSAALDAAILAVRGTQLRHLAETRVPLAESCRSWAIAGFGPLMSFVLLGGAAIFLALPALVVQFLTGWALITLLATTGLKLAAMIAARRPAPPPLPKTSAPRPVVSIMVALFREPDIATRLVRRLGRLQYPRELLDVLLVVEEEDRATLRALTQAHLPPWIRVVVVPDGPLKTKPRALNYALTHCRGTIIGVYDAEDAPDPDQIDIVVQRFGAAPPEVACLQGILDFYNPRSNWLSRCFTMEYAAWFRLMLPGLARMGLPVPLGGTTLFFRRPALEQLGGWDAHNVTEDADLGLRLARHGYRTELIETVTEEEANCRTLPWIRQRSRWLKGYMMTWAVHMRAPRLLYRQLGAWKFFGVQVLFLGTLSQFLLAPLIWVFWAVPFNMLPSVSAALPSLVKWLCLGVFLLAEAVNLTAAILATRQTRHRWLWLWAPMLHLYFPLGALASYKAALELVTRPFYWDKTSHGHYAASAKVN